MIALSWTAMIVRPKLMLAAALWDGVLVAFSAAGDSGSGTTSSDTLKIALVSAAGLVLSVTIPALIGTRRRAADPTPANPDPATKALIDSNNQRRREYAELAREHRLAEERIDALEQLCWEHGINPHTGVATGRAE